MKYFLPACVRGVGYILAFALTYLTVHTVLTTILALISGETFIGLFQSGLALLSILLTILTIGIILKIEADIEKEANRRNEYR
tara:strand:- start:19531 stop:19779 length:249 start_codon:yes stop_codon:yes gene_type:complete